MRNDFVRLMSKEEADEVVRRNTLDDERWSYHAVEGPIPLKYTLTISTKAFESGERFAVEIRDEEGESLGFF